MSTMRYEPNAHRLPVVAPDRCVHAVSPQATCQRCIEVCPREAWVLGEDSLGLNEEACDACGLCRPACPENAIEIDVGSPMRSAADSDLALVACEESQVEASAGVLPCLHVLGTRDLARLYNAGIRRLVVSRGRCETCLRGRQRGFETAVTNLKALLADRGLEEFTVTEVTAPEWQAEAQSARQPSRRALFAALCQPDVLQESAETEDAPSAAAILQGRDVARLVQWRPEIDPSSCNGCDACVHICPHGVISLTSDETNGMSYAIDGLQCTGCGLCTDSCASEAVTVAAWPPQRMVRVELDERQCTACGNHYHLSIMHRPGSGRCPICERSQHHRNLFQVLE